MSGEKTRPPVGYKNPPQHARFQKGQSGNPSGRRKARSLPRLFEEFAKFLGEPIQVTQNGRQQSISYVGAFLRKTGEAALKGDARARDSILKLLVQYELALHGEPQALTNEQEEALIASFLSRRGRGAGGGGDA